MIGVSPIDVDAIDPAPVGPAEESWFSPCVLPLPIGRRLVVERVLAVSVILFLVCAGSSPYGGLLFFRGLRFLCLL